MVQKKTGPKGKGSAPAYDKRSRDSGKEDDDFDVPDGFVENRQSLAGWFIRRKNNSVCGILRGNFEIEGKFGQRRIHRIDITRGSTDVTDSEGDEISLTEGTIGLDETGYLRGLNDIAVGTEVFIGCKGKGPDTQDPWIFKIWTMPKPKRDRRPNQQSEDDVPF